MSDGTPTPVPTPSCGNSEVCKQLYDWTHQAWLAQSSYFVLVKPLRIVVIVLAAMLVRHLLARAINKMVRSTAAGSVPTILRPLKEKMPTALQDAT
ncbi:MAG TPA: mechanosensitive ion channel family protein, partial [Micromonosporaceae bacterium]|nr:mechanosensitive ion channel family protein [Micromonosporaceae bacterium]